MWKGMVAIAIAGVAFVQGAERIEVPLWAHGAPGSEGMTAKEIVDGPEVTHDNTRVHSIHNPSLTVFLPAPELATGAAVIIAPGGGHQFLSIDTEGYNVAEYLRSVGVAAFVLKYRLAREKGSTYKIEVQALQDAQRAIRMVRSRADEWHVNPGRVGIMGFSAGGELAVMAATRFDAGKPDASDAIDRVSSRPDFEALIYPGVKAETIEITKDTPPTFLLCADNDKNPSLALGALYVALKKAGVPVEMHVYNSGGHGFGLRTPPKAIPITSTWNLRFRDWMEDRGLLKK